MIGGRFGGLLRAAQAGDAEAFDEVWRDLNPVLLRYLRAVVGAGRSDPEALAADTWVDAARGLSAFCGDEATWRGWVLRLARRRARIDARRLRWADTAVASAAGRTGAAPTPAGPSGRVTAFRARLTLQDVVTTFALDLVETLPRLEREVLALRAAAGLGVDEAARVVGRGRQTVRAAGFRGAVAVARAPQWGPAAPVAAAALNAAIEPLLSGAVVGEEAPIEVLRLADVTRALSAGPTPAELVGSGPAYAAFYRYVGPGAVARGRSHVRLVAPLGTRIVTGVAAAVVALGGTAAVAAAGALPGPLQDVAHDFFRAPASDSGGSAPDRPDRSPGSGAASTPFSVPGSVSGSPTAGTPTASGSSAPSRPGSSRRSSDGPGSAPVLPGATLLPSGAVEPTVPTDPLTDVPTDVPTDTPSPTPSDPSDSPSGSPTDSPSPTPVGGRPSTTPAPHTTPPGKPSKTSTAAGPHRGKP